MLILKNNITIGTWNVRSLRAAGKVEELTHEMKRYQWNIIGLCEVRWKKNNFDETSTPEGHKLFFSGREGRYEHGVGFLIHKDTVNAIMGCRPVSSRLITVRLKASPFNITIIQAYAPTTDYDDDDIEDFYDQLQEVIDQTPNKDILVVQGDWNANIGEDASKNWKETCGQYCYCNPETNERGLRLLEFASYNNLKVVNTSGPHKPSRRWTWHSPGGDYHNQIDYIMVKPRFQSSVNIAKTRSFPGADMGSDHELVMMTFKLRFQRVKNQGIIRIRFRLKKLNDPNIEAKKPWVTDNILKLCDKRRELKQKKNTTEGAKLYKEANQQVKKGMRKALETWIEEQCQGIEENLQKINNKKAYQLVKELTSSKQGRTTTIQDKAGKCLTEEQDILKRWREYCSELYAHTPTGDRKVLDVPPPINNDSYPILREEVEAAVKSLKKGKFSGVDNIPSELVKAGGKAMIDMLLIFCNNIWQTGEWPTPWTKSLIITLLKKGNLQLCQNYRTISLISHPSKVMLRILLNRQKPQAEEIIKEEQAGFRAGRSTTE